MKIGIDLDGVVFDSEVQYRIYEELYEENYLHINKKIDNKAIRILDRFSWNEEEFKTFLELYHEKVTKEANFMPGAIEVLNLLKKEGHTLIIITARGGINKSLIPLTEKRLAEKGLDIFDKYYWGTENKFEICNKENIDIMIDDNIEKCSAIANTGRKVIYFQDISSYDACHDNITTLYNWGEIYRYIKNMNKERYIGNDK